MSFLSGMTDYPVELAGTAGPVALGLTFGSGGSLPAGAGAKASFEPGPPASTGSNAHITRFKMDPEAVAAEEERAVIPAVYPTNCLSARMVLLDKALSELAGHILECARRLTVVVDTQRTRKASRFACPGARV